MKSAIAAAACVAAACTSAVQIASAESRCDASFQMGLSLGKSGTGPGQMMYNNMLASARKVGCEKEFIAGNTKGFAERKDVGDPASDTSGPR